VLSVYIVNVYFYLLEMSHGSSICEYQKKKNFAWTFPAIFSYNMTIAPNYVNYFAFVKGPKLEAGHLPERVVLIFHTVSGD
jgi:hypothetical protein